MPSHARAKSSTGPAPSGGDEAARTVRNIYPYPLTASPYGVDVAPGEEIDDPDGLLTGAHWEPVTPNPAVAAPAATPAEES